MNEGRVGEERLELGPSRPVATSQGGGTRSRWVPLTITSGHCKHPPASRVFAGAVVSPIKGEAGPASCR